MNALRAFPARRQRGVSLIEALVAFAVMAIGMLGVMGVQTTLRFNSDISKQRSEATRLAQEQMELLRSFSVLPTTPGVRAFDDIANSGPADVAGYTMTNTTYTLTTEVQAFADRKDVRVTVAWDDRQGTELRPSVVLNSVIAGVDPALSGMLSLPPNGSPLKNPLGRHVGIPIGAGFQQDPRFSVFTPPGGSVHWVFNNATGVITRVCTVRDGNEVLGCTAVFGRLVTGVVRFDTDGQVSGPEAENPLGSLALPLDMQLTTQGGESSQCFDEPANGGTAVRYFCVVTTNENANWSGTLDVVGLATGITADTFRVCRYSADYNGRGGIENLEHPRVYSDVDGILTNQNFLVIRGDNSCPTDGAADPDQGNFVDSSTVEHAPNPA